MVLMQILSCSLLVQERYLTNWNDFYRKLCSELIAKFRSDQLLNAYLDWVFKVRAIFFLSTVSAQLIKAEILKIVASIASGRIFLTQSGYFFVPYLVDLSSILASSTAMA